ncbi:aminopeptidase P N-terminal domain-containing protein [Candidatus Saccharibacteria bacterium]|nr:aminopeptidase P N-terminal domain-containing protein [Candidatus Saccharibacteria bacterium]MCA9313548.1 aminopeptidase P N-terminal domain-containing protein [Candidatus Saccharibacteria bacterium]
MFGSKFYINNRKKLLSLLPEDALVIITANGLMQRSADTTYSFQQDSNFWYLTGVDEPDVVLVMSVNEQFLILPKRSDTEDIFSGRLNCDEIAKTAGINLIYEYSEGWARYKIMQKSRKTIHTIFAPPSKIILTDSFYTNQSRSRLVQKLRRYNNMIALEDVRGILTEMRQVKQPMEVRAIQRAIHITESAFEKVKTILSPGVAEYELEAEITRVFISQQATHAYQPIIAGGTRACTLHYIKNNQILAEDDLCLIDIGAQYAHYAADITRTLPVNGPMSKRQQLVFEAVNRVHKFATSIIKIGLPWKEYNMQIQHYMGEELIKLGLITNNTSEEVRRYFPHSVSHSLGLDVHDVCDYKIMQDGMVITVEPGIYIPEEGIGIRIEDDVLITSMGARNLSTMI